MDSLRECLFSLDKSPKKVYYNVEYLKIGFYFVQYE